MKFLDLFSGIGGIRLGLEQAGHECFGFVEWDKYARKSYEAMHDTTDEWTAHDITEVTDDQWSELNGKVNIIAGGSPCQAFSIAGQRKGFEDTRGTMFFQYARAVKNIQPEFFLFENVKGLLSHDKQNTIKTMLKTFDEIGYAVDFDIFNSKYYGVPQNRERIFILGKRKDLVDSECKYVIKSKKTLDKIKEWANDNISIANLLPDNDSLTVDSKLKDILEQEVDEKFYLSQERVDKLTFNLKEKESDIKLFGKLGGSFRSTNEVLDESGVSTCLNTMGGGDREPKVAQGVQYNRKDGDPSFTLTSQDRHGVMIKEATKKGYKLAKDGDAVNFQYPDSETRRGRVGKQVANTLEAGNVNQGVVCIDDQGRIKDEYKTHDIVPTLRAQPHGDEPKVVIPKKVIDEVRRIAEKNRKKEEIGITLKSNGDIRPHRMDVKKSGLSELNVNYENNSSYTTTSTHMPKVYGDSTDYRIRKLTPKECFRLQGFPDELFDKAQEVNSNSQLYKQAGNSVTVNVIHAIAETIKLEDE